MSKHLQIDHLVYATPDLAASVEAIEAIFGVAPRPGGAHLGLGTFNALLGLGGRTYLEIIGPDPAQPTPDSARPFGIDSLREPALVAWCAAPHQPLSVVIDCARQAGYEPGEEQLSRRQRPDGVVLEWTMTHPPSPISQGGILPFFIDWGRAEHPTSSLPIGGTLLTLNLLHHQPKLIDIILSAISDEGMLGDEESNIVLNYAEATSLSAQIMTANGLIVLK